MSDIAYRRICTAVAPAHAPQRRNVVHRRGSALTMWADVVSGGPATIQGVVRIVTTPTGGCSVVLLEQSTLRLRRRTISAANGAYAFPNVAAGRQWVVLAFDPMGAYNVVGADRVQT